MMDAWGGNKLKLKEWIRCYPITSVQCTRHLAVLLSVACLYERWWKEKGVERTRILCSSKRSLWEL